MLSGSFASNGNVRDLGEMTRDEVEEQARTGAILVLPIASTEQHGHHLPMLTDTLILSAILAEVAKRIPEGLGMVIAPVLPFGNSEHHLPWSALSLRPSTLSRILNDLGTSAYRSGFRRLFVVNGHGGNSECMRLFAKELVLQANVAVATCSYWELSESRDIGECAIHINIPGHAGGYETSLMLAVQPSLVRAQGVKEESSPAERPLFDGELVQGLMVQRWGEWERVGGVTDVGDQADAELGRRLLEDRVVALLGALVGFDKATRERQPVR